MNKIFYILANMTIFISTSLADVCDPTRVQDSFPVITSSVANENAGILCNYYNANISSSRKKCVLNEVARRCEITSGQGKLRSFAECLERTSDILFSTVLKSDSYQEKIACNNFERKYANGSTTLALPKSIHSSGSLEFSNHQGPFKVFIITPFKINPTLSESPRGKIEYEIEAENDKFLKLGLESFQAYYIPSTNLLVISSGNKVNCGYSYGKINGEVTSNGLTGVCLTKVNISLPDIKNVQIKSISITDLVFASVGLDPDLVNFLEAIQDENAPIDKAEIIDLTKK